jgi:hypothetical protein
MAGAGRQASGRSENVKRLRLRRTPPICVAPSLLFNRAKGPEASSRPEECVWIPVKMASRRIGRRWGRPERRKHCAGRLWLPGNPAVCYRPRITAEKVLDLIYADLSQSPPRVPHPMRVCTGPTFKIASPWVT